MSKALNKPIEGRLAERPTSLFKIIVLSLTFIAILAYSVIELGFENGLKITAFLVIIIILSYFHGKNKSK